MYLAIAQVQALVNALSGALRLYSRELHPSMVQQPHKNETVTLFTLPATQRIIDLRYWEVFFYIRF
jgi:hypothetical protein